MDPIAIRQLMDSCDLCNRHCHVNRNQTIGYCGQTAELRAARAALHFWEEPCISGKNGSGTIFFSGCSLRCVFCQNHKIAVSSAVSPSSSKNSKTISIDRLAEIFLELQKKGAHNINLVTPTHFIPQIASALTLAKDQGLSLSIVYNTGSYETVKALKMLDGLIDIYLPDLKYYSPELSARYSNAPDYFTCASAAIEEMFRQVGKPQFFSDLTDSVLPFSAPADSSLSFSGSTDSSPHLSDSAHSSLPLSEQSENCLMKKGVIIRHLLLPGCLEDSKKILSFLHHTYNDSVFVSIMSQYTPTAHFSSHTENPSQSSYLTKYPELSRRVTENEYDELIDFALELGMENAFIQDMDVAEESFIPEFNADGL